MQELKFQGTGQGRSRRYVRLCIDLGAQPNLYGESVRRDGWWRGASYRSNGSGVCFREDDENASFPTSHTQRITKVVGEVSHDPVAMAV